MAVELVELLRRDDAQWLGRHSRGRQPLHGFRTVYLVVEAVMNTAERTDLLSRMLAGDRAVVNVQDYLFAVAQAGQTSLRSMIGKSELDDLLSNREWLNEGLEVMIDSFALEWGIHIDRVEIKDVALPDARKRSMSF